MAVAARTLAQFVEWEDREPSHPNKPGVKQAAYPCSYDVRAYYNTPRQGRKHPMPRADPGRYSKISSKTPVVRANDRGCVLHVSWGDP